MYGNFGNYGKKNKISLPTLGHSKKWLYLFISFFLIIINIYY
jgi:hypothetical protein